MTARSLLLGERNPLRRRRPNGSVGPRGSITFPTTFLVSRVQIALGADLSADPLTWAWEDITRYVRTDLGISLSVGRRDEATKVTTGSGQIKLDNRDGRFSRRNPMSPYYGLLTMNTPIWVTVDAGSGEKARMQMFVNEWPTRWDKSGNDSTVTIQCAGVLRRLAQGKVAKSALRRAILLSAPEAYWPLEDGDAAEAAGAAVEGPPLRIAGIVDFAAFTDLAGALQTPLMANGTLFGSVSGVSATSWHAEFAIKMPFEAVSVVARVYSRSTEAAIWRIFLPTAAGGSCQVFVTDITGSSVLFNLTGSAVAGTFENRWHHIGITAEQSGGNIVGKLYVDGVLESTNSGAGTLGEPYEFWANHQLANVTSMAHIAVGSGVVLSNAAKALDGYVGEMAHARMTRVAGEEGVPFETLASRSPALGRQTIGTLIDVMREAEAASLGVLYEKRWGLAFQSLAERYNAPVGLALDFDAGHIAEPPEPADDDQRVINRFTAGRTGGSEYTAELATGAMGTGIEGPGLYDDSGRFNLERDTQLADQAGFRVHLGTVDEDRWPSIALNFAHDPDLIDVWAALGYGARLSVANPPGQMPPDPLDLIVEGYSERWDPFIWTAELNCSPAVAYRVHVVASTDGNLGRLSATDSTLATDATDVATIISVATPGVLWVTGAVNFDINVTGERMTVTNIAGASSPQTFTVTRSVNGVVKAQRALIGGHPVRVNLWQPGVIAL